MKLVETETATKAPQPESIESVLSGIGAELRNNQETSEGNSTEYRGMIGSLMYASVGTRPDIAFAVHQAARHMENPSREDLNACKRIFRYVSTTADLGISFGGKNSDQLLKGM